jgi:predicted metalloprotease with PDZ domain
MRLHRTSISARLGLPLVIATFSLLASGMAAAAEPADRAATEKQLADARARLDDAARDVAELSRQLYGGNEQDLMRMVHGAGARGAMLGINIGGEQSRDDGVQVMGVSPSGPAQSAGLRTGDVIVAVDGKPLKQTADRSPGRQLVDYMRGVQPGQAVKVEYLRDGKRMSASVTAAPAEPPIARIMRERFAMPGFEGMMPPGLPDLLGRGHAFGELELVPVTPKLGQYFGTDKGLLVVRAPAESGFKLEDGDVILAIDGRVPEAPGHAFRILGSYQPGEKVKIDILRNHKRMTVEATMPTGGEMGGPRAHPALPRMAPPPDAAPPAPAAPAVPPPKPDPV